MRSALRRHQLRLARLEHLARGAEPELRQQQRQLDRFSFETHVVAEAMAPGHRRTRLPGIQLPGMEIKHHGLTLVRVHVVDAPADQLVRREAEVAAAADRQVDAKNAGGADRKLRQPREPAAADAVWKPRRARTAVAV